MDTASPSRTSRRLRILALTGALLGGSLAGWWLAAAAAPVRAGAALVPVAIMNFAFDPQAVTIDVGDTVRWTNMDDADHTATSTSGPVAFNSGTLQLNETFDVTFTVPGVYTYQCAFHKSMTGTITVRAAATPPPTSTPNPTPSGSATPAPEASQLSDSSAPPAGSAFGPLAVWLVLGGSLVVLAGWTAAERRQRLP